MTLTARQQARVNEAPPHLKAKLRASYNLQNAGTVPGRPRDAKQSALFIGPRLPDVAIRRGSAQVRTPGPKRRASPKPPGLRRLPNFLDPCVPHPVPSIMSDGMALAHTSLVSEDFHVGTTNTTLLVITNVGNSGTVGYLYEITPTGNEVVGGPIALTIPTLSLADDAGGPSAGRAMKLSCSVINCTNSLKRGGRVTYINSSQRLPALGGTTSLWNFSGIINGVKSSPYRRRITGDNLVVPKQLISFPIDSSTYGRFGPWRGTLTSPEFHQHTLGASDTNVLADSLTQTQRPMSVIAFIFDPATDVQDYSVTIRASYYTRWPLTSVPGQSMKTIPTAPPGILNTVINDAEANANDLAHLGEGALAATLGPRAATAISGVARSAFGAVRAGASGIEAAGAGMAEVGELALANPEMLAPLLL